MSDLDDILEYRRKLDQAHRRVAMAEGALKQTFLRLRKEYKCRGIPHGRKLLHEAQERLAKLEHKAEKKLKAFTDKWKEQL